MVSEYCDTYHNQKKRIREGDRIPDASRVYDHEEMVNLVDSLLEFWRRQDVIQNSLKKNLPNIWV